MRAAWAAAVGLAAFLAAASAQEAAPPDSIRLSGRVSRFGLRPVSISIERDGSSVVLQPGPPPVGDVEVAFRLEASELADLVRLVRESEVLTDGPPWARAGPGPSHASRWDLTIELGSASRSRSFSAVQAFQPVERFLSRFIDQAETTRSLRAGDAIGVARRLMASAEAARLIRPAMLAAETIPALVRTIVAAQKPWVASEAATALLALAPAEEWPARVREALAGTRGEIRDAVLGACAHGLREPSRGGQRAAFAQIAAAELRERMEGWKGAGHAARATLLALLELLVEMRHDDALVAAVTRRISTPDAPFVAPGLTALGAEAIPVCLAFLADEDETLRLAGLALARELIRAVRTPRERDALTPAARSLLERRLPQDAIPRVETMAKDAAQTASVRQAAFSVLDLWNGRDRVAEAREEREAKARARAAERAAEEEAARRESEALRPPRGELSISGTVHAQNGVALAGFTVLAMRDDGSKSQPTRTHGSAVTAADGSFRIDGLVPGAFRLVAVRGDGGGWREFAGNTSTRDGVEAGSSGVVLRFKGAVLLGRLVNAEGAGLARRTVSARMRDAPSTLTEPNLDVQGWAETDADGRFAFLQLLPGVYDVTLHGAAYVRGGEGVATGGPEIVLEVPEGAAIAGRVLDESGAPIPDVRVVARRAGTYEDGPRASTDREGRYRIQGLHPEVRYDVGASVSDGPGEPAWGVAKDVEPGAADAVVFIDTRPRLAFRVDLRGRQTGRVARALRITREGPDPAQFEFPLRPFLWRKAPPGTWRVSVCLRDLDADGNAVDRWVDLGTVATGAAEVTLVAPR